MNESFYIPKAILMDKESGRQFKAIPLSEIKPWPTGPVEEDSQTPPLFHKTITIQMSKKDSKSFRRLLRRDIKLPRKLKKAFRHIGIFEDPMVVEKDGNSISYKQSFWFGPKNGYPKTKWIKKALKICNQRLVKQ